MFKKLLLITVAACGVLSAQQAVSEYLPLRDGNEWRYLNRRTGETHRIRVAQPAFIGGNTYYRLIGYVERPLWVRYEGEALVYRNEELDRDEVLTMFTPVDRAWSNAPFRPCEQESQAQARRVGFNGPAGDFPAALQIRYRSFACADNGIEDEIYQPGIGLVRRTITSFTGEGEFHLISATVGKLRLAAERNNNFRISVRRSRGGAQGDGLIATLRLNVDGAAIRTTKPFGQDYDLVLKDANGRQVWRWSEGKVFPAAIEDVVLVGLRDYEVFVPTTINGLALPEGSYTLEAWLTHGTERPLFSATLAFELPLID
jgi:hypothetical protein